MWAHSVNVKGVRHRLDDHLRGCAKLARVFAEPFGLGDVAWWAGLAHDGGKAWCDWQSKLLLVEATGGRVGIDHKSYGVQLAEQHKLKPVKWMIAGHHGGLTCDAAVHQLLGESAEQEELLRSVPWADAERVLRSLVPELFDRVPSLPADFAPGADPLTAEFAVRFLFSALVDADALDTQAHRLGWPEPRLGVPLDAQVMLERFLDRRKRFLAGRPSTEGSSMDSLRELVFESAYNGAALKPGLFRLTAPTGAAKTIATAAFALRHAALHGKRRVIVAVPFITVTEQNAGVYRTLLDDDDVDAEPVVLEHHSSVDLDPDDGWDARARWQRLAAENWDARFVVTTTVQLFESLFGRKPSRMRKVHRIADSVIVLDEVQALPHRLLPQIVDALRILTRRFGVTVLLSSATQPELQTFGPLKDLVPVELVPDPVAVFESARRVRFRWWTIPQPTLTQVVAEAVEHPQVLVVVNTVSNARTVFEETRRVAGPDVTVLHLSTRMCSTHRRLVLVAAKALLAAKAPLVLVSTSLVEAGVDLDFPVVYRAVAPPESEAQVAGRCNREGSLGPQGGLVVLFDPSDGGTPPLYRTQLQKAKAYFGPDLADPEDIEALSEYFTALYQTLGLDQPGSAAKTVERHRRLWDFRSVTDGPVKRGITQRDPEKAFKMIVEDTVAVVVRFGDAGERRLVDDALCDLRSPNPVPGVWRRLQPYLVTIRRHTAELPHVKALLTPVVGDLFEWLGDYDDGFGLPIDPPREDWIL